MSDYGDDEPRGGGGGEDRGGGGGGGGGERKGPPNIDGMTTLKVDNIRFDCSADDLRDLFKDTGDIGDIYIPRDHRSGDSRGFAFVRYYNKDDAERAMEKLDGTEFRGRDIRVAFANRKRPENPREHFRGGRRFDDRGGGGGYRGGYNDRGYGGGGGYNDRGYGGGGGYGRDRGYGGGGGGGYGDRGGGGYNDRGGYGSRGGGGYDRYDDRGGGRGRSRSPPRGGRSRSRSPPPRRGSPRYD